jgi:uncharacterized damage-inducible protein DinB
MASITVDALRTMLDFNYWARDQILDKAAELTEDEFTRQVGLDHGSIRAMLVHMIGSATYLRGRATNSKPEPVADENAEYSVDGVRDAWRREENALQSTLDALSEEDLERSYDYEYAGKTYKSEPVWQLLFQIVIHDTQHRSEVAMALTQLGHSPGNIEFLTYTWRMSGN